MEEKNFKDFLKEQFEVKGVTPEKMSEHTGISERHIRALLQGETKKLPSAPYVRGYLSKIARVLDLNSSSVWKIYTEEFSVATSGPVDHLPRNRYAIQAVNRKWLFIGVGAFIVFLYLTLNASRLFGRPSLEISTPPSDTTTTNLATILLAGTVNPQDKLLIDNEEVIPDSTGSFSKEYALQPGLNQIQFTVSRFLGREMTVTRKVIYRQ
jgi:cytoskeletal protein RodZ